MSELMTSREEADILKNAITGLVNDFERMGFSRGQVGSAMAGIGLALVQVHEGRKTALGIVCAARDALMADLGYPQH